MELIKNTVRVGNSAGVLLPKKWLNTQVKVVLQPLNIEKEVLEILIEENLLKETLGVYLTGSYARDDQDIQSDIDILVITNKINKSIRRGKYEIICISEEEIKKQLKENIFPVLAMIKEAKPIINKDLIKEYRNNPLTKKNLKWYIETTNSRIENLQKDIELYKKANERYMSDNVAYILILRLRSLYIIDSMKKNRVWTKKGFLKIIKNISGSLKAYEGYLRSKNNEKVRSGLLIKEAEKLTEYLDKHIKIVEKWLKEKKD